MDTSSKSIFITGASSGFGRDMAETFSSGGHTVFAGIRDSRGRNRGIADTLTAKGLSALDLDVTDDKSVETAVQKLLAQSDTLDVVINNAGIASAGVSESFTSEQVRDLFDVNVFGVQRVLRAVLPKLRQQRNGLIINIGSILGRVTFPFFGLYGASKYAVEALTESYRYELSQLGIDVVLVEPSAYPTNMYSSVQKPEDGGKAEAYGEVGNIPGKMFSTFVEMFSSTQAPNPHEVAEAVGKVIAAPKGKRPDRVVVGQPFGADSVNAAVAPIQQQVLKGLGLDFLAAVQG